MPGPANLPCPFCGEKLPEPPVIETEYGAAVACMGCSALGPSVTATKPGQDTHTEALELWNRRTLGRAEPPPTSKDTDDP